MATKSKDFHGRCQLVLTCSNLKVSTNSSGQIVADNQCQGNLEPLAACCGIALRTGYVITDYNYGLAVTHEAQLGGIHTKGHKMLYRSGMSRGGHVVLTEPKVTYVNSFI